jgi:hypothetical protein
MEMRGKIMAFCATVAGVMLVHQYGGFALVDVPMHVTHTINPACIWDRRVWFRVLAPMIRDIEWRHEDPIDQDMLYQCYRTHGLKSRTPYLKTIMPRWPTAAQFGAWERQDRENSDALRRGR